MQLKETTSKKLNTWLANNWHTTHDLDQRRFHLFVDAYAREHGTYLDEGAIREEIQERFKAREKRAMPEGLVTILNQRISTMYEILDFLKNSERETDSE